MAKKRFDFSNLRRSYVNYYHNRYYDIWINLFRYKELDYQQNEYIFRKLWSEGSIAGFIAKNTKGSSVAPEGLPVFAMYTPAEYNIYDYATKCNLVNNRGVNFIPNTMQTIDKDVVIFYSNRLRKGTFAFIEPLIQRLALVECVIKINLNAHKTPFLIPIAPEDEAQLKKLWEDIENDEEVVFLKAENFDKLKVLLMGNQYIIDKLYQVKDRVEGEIREFFGFNNIPVGEKKEHLISSEVDSNNQFTDFRYNTLKTILEDNAKRFTEVFGYSLTLEENRPVNEGNKEEKELEDEI